MTDAEFIARNFHETLQRLNETHTPWAVVPETTKDLWVAVCQILLDDGAISRAPDPKVPIGPVFAYQLKIGEHFRLKRQPDILLTVEGRGYGGKVMTRRGSCSGQCHVIREPT